MANTSPDTSGTQGAHRGGLPRTAEDTTERVCLYPPSTAGSWADRARCVRCMPPIYSSSGVFCSGIKCLNCSGLPFAVSGVEPTGVSDSDRAAGTDLHGMRGHPAQTGRKHSDAYAGGTPVCARWSAESHTNVANIYRTFQLRCGVRVQNSYTVNGNESQRLDGKQISKPMKLTSVLFMRLLSRTAARTFQMNGDRVMLLSVLSTSGSLCLNGCDSAVFSC